MKHVKRFESYESKINEGVHPAVGIALFLAILKGLEFGYRGISHLVSLAKFSMAINKLTPIYDKIKDDEVMSDLVSQLDVNKLSFGEETWSSAAAQSKKSTNELIQKIYDRAKELLTPSEFEIFVSASKEVERGTGRPAGYFTGAKFDS